MPDRPETVPAPEPATAAGRPRLLDLFCGAGGAAMGYHRAGFDVVGVDIAPQPHYPFEFHQYDALEVLAQVILGDLIYGGRFDAIHASPPCQAYTALGSLHRDRHYPDLLGPVLNALRGSGVPWVVENVPGAPWPSDVFVALLCGSSFGLRVRRHREFACPFLVLSPPCQHATQGEVIGVYGNGFGLLTSARVRNGKDYGRRARDNAERQAALGMTWGDQRGLNQAVPPAYTEFIGERLLAYLAVTA